MSHSLLCVVLGAAYGRRAGRVGDQAGPDPGGGQSVRARPAACVRRLAAPRTAPLRPANHSTAEDTHGWAHGCSRLRDGWWGPAHGAEGEV